MIRLIAAMVVLRVRIQRQQKTKKKERRLLMMKTCAPYVSIELKIQNTIPVATSLAKFAFKLTCLTSK